MEKAYIILETVDHYDSDPDFCFGYDEKFNRKLINIDGVKIQTSIYSSISSAKEVVDKIILHGEWTLDDKGLHKTATFLEPEPDEYGYDCNKWNLWVGELCGDSSGSIEDDEYILSIVELEVVR